MSETEIRDRLARAASPAFRRPIDVEADLARGRRGRRRRRVRQAAAGASVCAIGGVAAVAGLPLLPDDGAGGQPAATPVGVDKPLDSRLGDAVDQYVGLNGEIIPTTRPGTYMYGTWLDDRESSRAELHVWIHDAAREGDERVPMLCEDVPDYYYPRSRNFDYDTCQRRTLSDGSSVVVGEGAQDLLVVRWGPGGDLIEVIAQWGPGEPHDVTLDGMLALSGDDRVQIRERDDVAAPDPK